MVAHLLTQSQSIIPGGDGNVRSINKIGSFATTPTIDVPIINTTGVQFDQYVTLGGTWQFTPTLSNSPAIYSWHLDVHPDECTINPLTGQVTLDTSTMPLIAGVSPNQSIYVQLVCHNAAGSTYLTIKLHIGKVASQIKYVGPSDTYPDLQSALTAMSSGDTVIIRDGTYTGVENSVYGGSGQSFQYGPVAGVTNTPSQIMAETPGRVVLDGETTRAMFTQTGNWLHPDWPGADSGAKTVDQSNCWIFGLVFKDGTASASFYHVQRCQFRYCIGLHAHNYSATHNISNLYVRDSELTVMEHCFVYGYGRYNFSTYQSRNNVIRRCLSRYAPYYGTEPHISCVSFYRDKDSLSQNCWAVDSSHLDAKWFNTALLTSTTSITSHSFQVASTGAWTYSTNNRFQRNGTVNVYNGAFYFAGEDAINTGYVDGAVIVNPHGYDSTSYPNHGVAISNSRANLFFDKLSVISADYGDVVLPNIINCQADVTVTNSLFDFVATGSAVKLINTWGSFTTESIDNYSVTGYGGTICDTQTNRTDILPTKANGQWYPVRQEEGSTLKASGIGADNLDYCIGRQGVYQDDVDAQTATNTPLLPFQMESVAMEHWRTTDWTGPNFDIGLGSTDTRFGDFGVAKTDESPSDYILASLGNPVFPLCVNSVATTATDVAVTWKHPASKHHDQIIAYDLYYKNETDLGAWTYYGSVDRFENRGDIPALTATKLYSFHVRSRYVDGRVSEKSYPTQVQL